MQDGRTRLVDTGMAENRLEQEGHAGDRLVLDRPTGGCLGEG